MLCFWMQQQAKQGKGHIPSSTFFLRDWWRDRKRTKKWVDFLKLKRAYWKPTKYSAVCSKHPARWRSTLLGLFLDSYTDRYRSKIGVAFLFHIQQANSRLIMAHWHLLVYHHLKCLLVPSRLMKTRLLSYTLRSFLRPRNTSLSKASIAGQHYQYMWLPFWSWTNVLSTKY